MASKSKKRRRVLGASCILAALIIAGSSFAWFTSKDEVTNRLTATSDYGVSIVESFTPPKMWVPGQEINKDVYAVNTGSIAAFVKENVSGILNYTFERKVGSWDKTCLELNDATKTAIDGVTTNEAGGFLAWTDATTKALSFDGTTAVKEGNKAGNIVAKNSTHGNGSGNENFTYEYVKDGKTYVGTSAAKNGEFYLVKQDDAVDKSDTANTLTLSEIDVPVALGELASARENEDPAVASRWTPTETGTYIFRRSINHNETNTPGDHPADDSFTYAGYYFVKGAENDDPSTTDVDETEDKYYKIVIGDDTFRAEKTVDNETGRVDFEFDVFADQSKVKGLDGTTLTFNRDGTITGTPKVWFVKEVNTDDLDVSFRYEEADTDNPTEALRHAPRLVVEYSTLAPSKNEDGTSTTTTGYDVVADRARAQVDYVNKKGQYIQDLTNYEQAVADYTYAKKLSTAREKLRAAADDMYNKNEAANNATTGTQHILDEAWSALKTAAQNGGTSLKTAIENLMITDSKDGDGKWQNQTDADLSPDELLGAAKGTNSDKSVLQVLQADQGDGSLGTTHVLDDVQADYEEMQRIWADIQEDIADLNAALAKYNDPMITPEQAKEYKDIVDAKLTSLNENLGLYKDAYADLLGTYEDASSHTASRLDLDPADTSATKAKIQGKADELGNSGTVGSKQAIFAQKVQEFINAFNDDEAADAALATSTAAWTAAKKTYNEEVKAAQKEYEDVVTNNADQVQPNVEVDYHDNSATIVAAYSARREQQTLVSDESNPGYNANPKHTSELVADPTLAEWNETNFGTAIYTTNNPNHNDFEYYRTLVQERTVNKPTSGASEVKKIPANDIDKVNENITWDEVNKADATAPDKTIKDLYEAVYGDGTASNVGSKKEYEDASAVYETAKAAADAKSNIKIYVNLAEDYADYWQYAGDTDQTGTESTTKAEFYYKYILEPGETSHKLVDSVTLADSVTAEDYKNLTFDLDVTLDSAQITYAGDQRTITTDAVDGNSDAFVLKVDEADKPLAFDQAFDWVARRPATSRIYTLGGTKLDDGADAFTALGDANKITVSGADALNGDYYYRIEVGGFTYLGKELKNGETFYKYNSTATPVLDSDDSKVLVIS